MKTKTTKVTTILFGTVLLTLLVAFFMLVMIYINGQPVYAEVSVSGDIVETPETAETSEATVEEESPLGKYGEIILSALLGGGGIGLASIMFGLFRKIGNFGKKLSSANMDNGAIKNCINGIADDCELLKNKIEQILNDNTALLNTLLNNLNTAEGRTTALCQTVAMLVSCSNLPDETKNLLLGTINTALGNKEDKDGDTNDKQA